MAASAGTETARQATLIERLGSELRIHLDRSAVDGTNCNTVHLTLSCDTAATYTPGYALPVHCC